MIHTSPYEDVFIPDVPLTTFIMGKANKYGDKLALIDGITGRSYTYKELFSKINIVAGNLRKMGFGKGDVMAIYSPNLPEYAIAFHAVSLVGGTNTTINPLYTVDELTHQLKDSKAKYLITISAFLDNAKEAAIKSGVKEIFTFDDVKGTNSFSELMEGSDHLTMITVNPNRDLVALPYSSGTTGLPKGVMLSHKNLVSNIMQIDGIEELTQDDTIVAILPFFHIYGMLVILNYSLYQGATVVTLPRFDLEGFLKTLQDHGVTNAALVPPIVLALAKHPLVDKYDLSKLKSINSGAAPLSEELAFACAERLNCIVKQAYGLTETSPATHVMPTKEGHRKQGSVGPAVRNTEVRIVDVDSGKDLGVDQRGEVWIRGPQVMVGYLNNEEATKATIDEEGWLHTGDIGYVDDEGYFYIVDRLKELIKYKGYQVAPAELEALLLTHPKIADAAVIPSPDEEAGEVPKAFVVLKPDMEMSAEDVMGYVAEKVSPQKKVRKVEFVESIPKSASGKILRRVLVEQERAK